jgi:hypothetical protein
VQKKYSLNLTKNALWKTYLENFSKTQFGFGFFSPWGEKKWGS